MAEKDYYLILPLLLYGLAVADLISSWRSLLRAENIYLPYTMTSILLLELAFWNFFGMYHWISDGTTMSYLSYLKILLAPLVFILTVAVLTPEQEIKDVKAYFMENMRAVFLLTALFTCLHFVYGIDSLFWPRIIGATLLLITAITRKVWIVYILVAFRVTTLFALVDN